LPKKTGVFFFLLSMFIVFGCENGNPSETINKNNTTNEESAEVEQLKAEIVSLKSKLEQCETQCESCKSKENSIPPDEREAYSRLVPFRSVSPESVWDEVTVLDDKHRVTISDRDFLESLKSHLIIGDPISWGGAIPYTLEPFSIELRNKNESVLILVHAREAVEFPEILPGRFFRVDAGLTSLGRALLPKPDFMPAESLERRMLDSGFLLVRRDNLRYYAIDESRVRGVAAAFLRSDRKEAPKPDIQDGAFLTEISFFLYGDAIVMTVYPEWIRIKDGETETWYRVSPFDVEQIDISLMAG
jgi:hypothetical protein